MDSFLLGLQHISSNLSKEELQNMKFLCKKHVGKKKLYEIQQGIDLFSHLMQQNLLSIHDTSLLISMLRSLKRDDLIQDFANYMGNKSHPGEQLDPKVEGQLEEAFKFLCDEIGRDWRRVVRNLGVSQADIEKVMYANPYDLKEQFYQSLLLWKKSNGQKASVSIVEKALRDCDLNLTADNLAERLKNIHL